MWFYQEAKFPKDKQVKEEETLMTIVEPEKVTPIAKTKTAATNKKKTKKK